METKIQKKLVFKGFGFPILLLNVPMIKVFGDWAMDVKLNKLQLVVLYQVLRKTTLLNGDEIKFIRKFLNMTVIEFGKIFGVTHPTVLKWESKESHISATSDVYLRLYVLNHLLDHQAAHNKEFRNTFAAIDPSNLAKEGAKKGPSISINLEEELEIA